MGQWTGQFRLRSRAANVALALALAARPLLADEAEVTLPDVPPIAVPSGQEVRFIETISDAQGPMGLTLRFRFLAPQIGGTDPIDGELALSDMEALCNGFAIERLPKLGPQPAQIVISLSDRVVPFGEVDDDAVQFFEAYSIQDGACVWEMF